MTDEWIEYKKLVMSELERLDKCQAKLRAMYDRALIGALALIVSAVAVFILDRLAS